MIYNFKNHYEEFKKTNESLYKLSIAEAVNDYFWCIEDINKLINENEKTFNDLCEFIYDYTILTNYDYYEVLKCLNSLIANETIVIEDFINYEKLSKALNDNIEY